MKQWFVVQVHTGFEGVVKKDLLARIAEEGLQDFFGEILVPVVGAPQQRVSMASLSGSSTAEAEKEEKIFPGYLLVHMEMTGESFRLVSTTRRVTRFLGGATPMPLSESEVERIFSQVEGKLPIVSKEPAFVEGGEVQIVTGPFSGFVAVVEKVDEEHEKLTVMVSIFGRLTPVEVGFSQVKK